MTDLTAIIINSGIALTALGLAGRALLGRRFFIDHRRNQEG